jgi:catechol 2,3-dioxygenase
MALQFSHAVLHVKDLANMLDYYTRVLGFAVADRGPLDDNRGEIVFLSQDPGEHHQLAFVPAPRNDGLGALNHLAFRLEDLSELRMLDARIRADGRGRIPAPITHGNTWSIYFADPEGNGIEVFCDTPWHVQQPQGRSWDMTQDDATLQQATRAAFENQPQFGPGDRFRKARERVQSQAQRS